MSHSREELEQIVGDFNKIASRPEKKASTMNARMMVGIIAVIVIVAAIGAYLYLQQSKKGSSSKTATPPAAANPLPVVSI